MRLLIVEDEGSLRRSLGRYFERRGYQVVLSGSLAEARAELARERVDVAIVDVCLPDGNGLDLVERIGPARTIAMTAHPGFAAFAGLPPMHRMEKPLDLSRTERLVAQMLAA